MDDEKKIIKIYYNNFLNDRYDFDGIILTPHISRSGDEIIWDAKNPKKLSSSKNRLIDYVHDLFFDYCRFVSNGPKGQRATYDLLQSRVTKINGGGMYNKGYVYINDKDNILLNLKLSQIKKMFYTSDEDDDYIFDVDFFKYELDNSHGDDFHCSFAVACLSGLKNGERLNNIEIKNVFKDIFYEDKFLEYQENLMHPFWVPIISNPLLFDNNNSYYTNDFILYDDNGKKINL